MIVDGKSYTIHEKEMHLNKVRLKSIVDMRGMEYKELFTKAEKKFGLDITYKTFMNLISNRSTWKLIYAWAIADILNVEIPDLFDIVDIDLDDAKIERKNWEEKYYKK